MNKQRRGDLARVTLNYDSDPNNRAPASHILAISHPIWIIIWNWEFIGDSKRFSHNSAMGPKSNDQESSGSIESVEAQNWPLRIQNWPQNLRTWLKSGATCSCLGWWLCTSPKYQGLWWDDGPALNESKTHGEAERKYDCDVGLRKCRPIVPTSPNRQLVATLSFCFFLQSLCKYFL